MQAPVLKTKNLQNSSNLLIKAANKEKNEFKLELPSMVLIYSSQLSYFDMRLSPNTLLTPLVEFRDL